MYKDHPPLINKRELFSAVRKAFILTAVAYLALVPWTINQKTSLDVISSLRDKGGECDFNRHYKVAASLGAGNYQTPEGNYLPTTFGRDRIGLAAILYADGFVDNVVLLEGFQGQNADPNVGRDYLENSVETFSQGKVKLDRKKAFSEWKSTSTATNLDALDIFMLENGWDEAIVITNRIHKPRVEALIKIKNINACVLTVENGTLKLNPEGMDEIKIHNNGKGKAWRKMMEIIKTISLFYDPQGKSTAEIERVFMGLGSGLK
jgi:hypothetical protein